MKKFLKEKKEIIITISIAISLSFIFLLIQNIFKLEKSRDILICIINSLFTTGIVIVGFGLLVFVNNEGIFNIFVYGIKSAFNVMRFNHEKQKTKETYQEYCQKRKKNKFGYIIIIGLIFILISIVIYIIVEAVN